MLNKDIAKLAKAVREQLGSEDDEEFFATCENVAGCSCGANGGFGGFIYYTETTDFYRKNRSTIKKSLQNLAEELGESTIGMVKGFNSIKGDFSEDEVGKALYGRYDENLYIIYDTLAKYALEEVASRASDFAYECEN